MVDTKGLEPLPEGTRRASPSDSSSQTATAISEAANLLIDRLRQDAVKVEG